MVESRGVQNYHNTHLEKIPNNHDTHHKSTISYQLSAINYQLGTVAELARRAVEYPAICPAICNILHISICRSFTTIVPSCAAVLCRALSAPVLCRAVRVPSACRLRAVVCRAVCVPVLVAVSVKEWETGWNMAFHKRGKDHKSLQ